jgi:thiamine biosynthesis lipoprotein ApbE
MYEKTGGIFNILVGEVLEHRGYDAKYSLAPQTNQEPIPPSPLSALTITPKKITLKAGQIDLGGFGKGYAIDLLAKRLQEKHGFEYFLRL